MRRGPALLLAISLAVGAMCAALAVAISPAPAAAGAVIRWTARTSLVLFALTYVARPLVQLAPSPASKALLAQRKWLGLGFAVSHGFHLLGIIWLASPDVSAFVRSQEPTSLVAASTFVALALMTVTSVESLKRELSPRAWRGLHLTGLHLAWISFTFTYAGALAVSPVYALPLVLLAAITAIRFAAWLRKRRRRRLR